MGTTQRAQFASIIFAIHRLEFYGWLALGDVPDVDRKTALSHDGHGPQWALLRPRSTSLDPSEIAFVPAPAGAELLLAVRRKPTVRT